MSYRVEDRRGKQREEEDKLPMAMREPSAPPRKKTLGEMSDECPLRPTPGRLIFIHDPARTKVGRIHAPDNASRRGTTGTIIRANPTSEEQGLICEVGNRVLIGRYAGTLVEFEGKPSWVIICYDEVLSVIYGDDDLVDQAV